MALNFKEIQARLLAQQEAKERSNNNSANFENVIYPFWLIPDNSVATFRFLPDGDETNDYFWLERQIIKIPFSGIKGQVSPPGKKVEVQVPCTDMWTPNSCPITAEIRPWWKDDALVPLARTYYKKKTYLFQGFVTSNPLVEDAEKAPENPIRRFIMNTEIFEIIKKIMLVTEIEHSPIDYDNGMDFYLKRTKSGQWPDYTSSSWTKPGSLSPKSRALTDVERAAIDKHGLWKLSQFLPKKPDEDHLNAIMEMFRASVDGEEYDPDRWSKFYTPNGFKGDANKNENASKPSTVVNIPTPAATSASVAAASSIMNKLNVPSSTESSSSVEKTGSAPKPVSPEDIIARLRERQSQK